MISGRAKTIFGRAEMISGRAKIISGRAEIVSARAKIITGRAPQAVEAGELSGYNLFGKSSDEPAARAGPAARVAGVPQQPHRVACDDHVHR
jgi:hypothetical protein